MEDKKNTDSGPCRSILPDFNTFRETDYTGKGTSTKEKSKTYTVKVLSKEENRSPTVRKKRAHESKEGNQ